MWESGRVYYFTGSIASGEYNDSNQRKKNDKKEERERRFLDVSSVGPSPLSTRSVTWLPPNCDRPEQLAHHARPFNLLGSRGSAFYLDLE